MTGNLLAKTIQLNYITSPAGKGLGFNRLIHVCL